MGKTLGGFDSSHVKFDKIKYIRQLRAVVAWRNNRARATVEAATGFGKTAIASIIIGKFLKKNPEDLKFGQSILVVVPTTALKEQWKKLLKLNNYHKNVEVFVINTVSLQEGFSREVDLLILDEIHLMAADKFKRVFSRVRYSWLLGLTATMDRLDGKHTLLQKVAPICDSISQKEAISKGWISDFIEFNLAVPITRKESEEQINLGKTIRFYMSKFGNFDTMLANMDRRNAQSYALYYNSGRPKDQHIEPKDVVKWATLGLRAIHKRKNFLDTTEHKIKASVELMKEFDVRLITFSQSTSFVEELSKHFDNTDFAVYHSNIPSQTRVVNKTKTYRSKLAAQKGKLKLEEKGFSVNIEIKESDYILHWKIDKQVSGKKIASENLIRFLEKKVNKMLTAKALDQGFDDDSILMGIDASRSESPTQHIQRTGRISRNLKLPNGEFAVKIYVNLYIPDWSVPNSRDEQKLRKCQIKNSEHVVWVDDLHQLKEFLNLILKKRENKSIDKKFIFENID